MFTAIDLCSMQDEGATNPKAAPYLEPKGAYSKLPPRAPGQEGEGEEEEDHKLTETDLLSFARQIAAGMVRSTSTHIIQKHTMKHNPEKTIVFNEGPAVFKHGTLVLLTSN